MMYYYGDFFSPFGFLGPILMMAFWGLVIYGLVMLFKRTSVSGEGGRAIEILKERYAKGEITKEQFETMKKDIQ